MYKSLAIQVLRRNNKIEQLHPAMCSTCTLRICYGIYQFFFKFSSLLLNRKARRKEKDAGATEDPKLYLEEAALERQLPELDLRMLVDLPAGLDYNEWLASHTLALFDHINLFYGTISEFCTMTGCPDMTGPGLRYNQTFPQETLASITLWLFKRKQTHRIL